MLVLLELQYCPYVKEDEPQMCETRVYVTICTCFSLLEKQKLPLKTRNF